MARLPVVSSDGNAWGTILNDFLSQAHNADGSIKNLYVNVKDPAYGAKGDGSTDDTAAIAAALSAANSAGGGIVFFPAGTYISTNQTLYANVHLLGAGVGATILKLKNATNTDLFSAQTGSINLSASLGSGPVGTLSSFSIKNMTLDGNKANQSSGTSYPLRFYGYKYVLRDLTIRNGYSGGILSDWNGGAEIVPSTSEQMEATLDNLYTHSNNGIGLQMGGPHDSRLSNITSYDNASHGFHLAPNMLGVLCTQIHPYQQHTGVGAVGMLCETGSAKFVNCMFEGSDTNQLVLLGSDCSVVGGEIFGNVGYAGIGVQLGQQAGLTPIAGQIFQSAGVTTAQVVAGTFLNTSFRACTNGAINEANVNTLNTYICDIYQASGSGISSGGGYLSASSTALLTIRGTTPDGSTGKGGAFQVGSGSFNGFIVFDTNGQILFDINTFNSIFALMNGRHFTGYSDAGTTQKYDFDASTGNIATSGNVAVGQSASAAATASSGTITTANIGEARIAPTGAITGVILQSGTVAGQTVTVVNESAFTVTFAASGTSHVADGVSAVIAANRKMDFTWDSGTSLWYHS